MLVRAALPYKKHYSQEALPDVKARRSELVHFLLYYFSAFLQTGCMFWIFLNAVTVFRLLTLSIRLVLRSNYNVVDPTSGENYHSY